MSSVCQKNICNIEVKYNIDRQTDIRALSSGTGIQNAGKINLILSFFRFFFCKRNKILLSVLLSKYGYWCQRYDNMYVMSTYLKYKIRLVQYTKLNEKLW